MTQDNKQKTSGAAAQQAEKGAASATIEEQTKAAPKTKAAPTARKAPSKRKRKSVKTETARMQKNNRARAKTVNPKKEDIMTTAKTQMDQFMQDAGNANKESWDTFMKAGNTFMKGMEEVMKISMTQAQKTAEKNSQNVKKLMACKTVNEFAELQTKTAQENFDEVMNNMTTLSELSVKVATDCLSPVNDQFSKTVKKATDTMAV